jgi:hypothetical protein
MARSMATASAMTEHATMIHIEALPVLRMPVRLVSKVRSRPRGRV